MRFHTFRIVRNKDRVTAMLRLSCRSFFPFTHSFIHFSDRGKISWSTPEKTPGSPKERDRERETERERQRRRDRDRQRSDSEPLAALFGEMICGRRNVASSCFRIRSIWFLFLLWTQQTVVLILIKLWRCRDSKWPDPNGKFGFPRKRQSRPIKKRVSKTVLIR